MIFRGLVGLGIGGLHVAFSLFLEFVPTEQRGRFAILVQAFWTIGALAEAALAWAVLPSLGWRYLLGISTIPFVVLLLFFPFLSESPRFLALKGKQLRAERVLARIAKLNGKELPAGKLMVRTPPTVSTEPKNFNYHVKKVTSGMFRGLAECVTLLTLLSEYVTTGNGVQTGVQCPDPTDPAALRHLVRPCHDVLRHRPAHDRAPVQGS